MVDDVSRPESRHGLGRADGYGAPRFLLGAARWGMGRPLRSTDLADSFSNAAAGGGRVNGDSGWAGDDYSRAFAGLDGLHGDRHGAQPTRLASLDT